MDNEPVRLSELDPEEKRELLDRMHELDEQRKLEALDKAHRAAHVASFMGGSMTLIGGVFVDGGLPVISSPLYIGIWAALGFLATLGVAKAVFGGECASSGLPWQLYPFSPSLVSSAFLYFMGAAVTAAVATIWNDGFEILLLIWFVTCVPIGIGSLIVRAVAFHASRGTKDSEVS